MKKTFGRRISIVGNYSPVVLAMGGLGDEPGAFRVPTGLTVGPQGRIYVCDSFNGRFQVFRYVGEPGE